MLVPVILSGGAGTRLWPVSRSAYPKPFMRMGDNESLLQKTLARALRIADGGPVLTVTGRDYYFLTRDEYATTASWTACHSCSSRRAATPRRPSCSPRCMLARISMPRRSCSCFRPIT